MQFCEQCKNMLFTKINQDDNSLQYICKNCGFESSKTEITENTCVYSKDYDHNELSYKYVINEYTCTDPTLPRVNDIKCVNSECETNQEGYPEDEREVVYIKYNKDKLYYVYICCKCKEVWKNII